MRVLHRGHGADRGEPGPGAASGPAGGTEGQFVPLHRLPLDRGRDRRRRPRRTRCGVDWRQRRQPRRSGHRDRFRPLHARYPATGRPAAFEAAAFAARPRQNPVGGHRGGAGAAGGPRGADAIGFPCVVVLHSAARGPAGRPRRHASAGRCRALHRPARRRGGGGHRGRRRGRLPGAEGCIRNPARRFRPGTGHAARRAVGPRRQGSRGAHPRSHPQPGRGDADHQWRRHGRPGRGRNCPHRDLHHPAAATCRAGNPRRDRMAGRHRLPHDPQQHPNPVPDPARIVRSVRFARRPRAGAVRAGRRRLRRQAGNVDRGHRRPGRPAHRPSPARSSSSARPAAIPCG